MSTHIHTVDLRKIWDEAQAVPIEHRMRAFMHAAGVEFFDAEKFFVKKASVAVAGVGGIPVSYVTDLPGALQGMQEMMGYAGFFSYLNPKNSSVEQMVSKMHELGHFSTAHSVYINVLVAGVSTAVENEFNSQRDLVHLARVTEARTSAQVLPSLVVLDPEYLPLYEHVFTATRTELESAPLLEGVSGEKKMDAYEARNLVFPAAKATTFLMSGTLRNFQKLLGGLMDSGKEDEYRRVLAQVADLLSPAFPALFKMSADLGYVQPKHF